MRALAKVHCLLTIASTAAVLLALGGCTRCCPSITAQPSGAPADLVFQEFFVGGQPATAWLVRYSAVPKYGLSITDAWFRRAPGEPWIKVLYEARVAEIFVPYHPGSPRYHDIQTFNWPVVTATRADAGCCGRLLGAPPKVVKEVRDRGVGWKDDQRVYRGRELVLWSTLNAANYNYLFQYGFRDDGTITFRLGATARNLPGAERVAHMHTGIWKVDLDLAGASHDSVLLVRHREPTGNLGAADVAASFNGGSEGSADWQAQEFTGLRILDTQTTNANGRNISYDLMPMRVGNARHWGVNETFVQHDFWAIRYAPGQITAQDLPAYVANGQSVVDSDVVVWHVTPLHHEPRDEDGRYVGNFWQGVALTMWGGFDLRPRNLFSETPLFTP
jgi:Cu2+-containing amine oxidase